MFSVGSRSGAFSFSWFKSAIKRCTATDTRRSSSGESSERALPGQQRAVARPYIILPGPVIPDNRLIKEVGLLAVEYSGTEGPGEQHAPARGPAVAKSA
jgi:hypothetical protein